MYGVYCGREFQTATMVWMRKCGGSLPGMYPVLRDPTGDPLSVDMRWCLFFVHQGVTEQRLLLSPWLILVSLGGGGGGVLVDGSLQALPSPATAASFPGPSAYRKIVDRGGLGLSFSSF